MYRDADVSGEKMYAECFPLGLAGRHLRAGRCQAIADALVEEGMATDTYDVDELLEIYAVLELQWAPELARPDVRADHVTYISLWGQSGWLGSPDYDHARRYYSPADAMAEVPYAGWDAVQVDLVVETVPVRD